MKELLVQYAEYNAWANSRITEALLQLDDTILEQELISSFSSLRATVYHVWSAEYIWLQRLQLAEHPVWIESAFDGTFAAAVSEWAKVSEGLQQFVKNQYDDKALMHMVQYNDRRGNLHKTPVFQVLQHTFNHSTYHRGQLVTMLRHAGVKELPSTDFIAFVWKK